METRNGGLPEPIIRGWAGLFSLSMLAVVAVAAVLAYGCGEAMVACFRASEYARSALALLFILSFVWVGWECIKVAFSIVPPAFKYAVLGREIEREEIEHQK